MKTSNQSHLGSAGWLGQATQVNCCPSEACGFRKLVVLSSSKEQVWVLRVRMDMWLQLWLVF